MIDWFDWLIDWLIHWLIDWLIDWLIHWLIDGLIDWLIDLMDLFDLIMMILSLISYPYGGTINFQIRLDMQPTTHQPPMPNSSQTSAWSHRYIGRGNGKTEIPLLVSERISEDWISKTDWSPIGFIAILWRLKTCKIALVKVTDLVLLRTLFGPGASDADLSIFKLGFSHKLT